jgi:uncharacterized protein
MTVAAKSGHCPSQTNHWWYEPLELTDLTARLETLAADRLAHWPSQWEGFHWPGYTWQHTLRVRNLALHLAAREGADEQVVALAALLHDLAKAEGKHHAQIGAEQAAQILAELGVDPDLTEAIRHAIDTHSGDNTHEHPAENRCLGDADLIDANFGLIATWRFISIRASRESTVPDTITAMADWLPKKDELIDLLRTQSGREVALERSATMHAFCERVAEQLNSEPESGFGILRLVDFIAANYERPVLETLLASVLAESEVTDEVQEACRRLAAEAAGEV